MIPYQEEKTTHSIAFFAKEHKKKAKKYLTQTGLYKYLSLFDFTSLEESGQPALDLEYRAMEKGPVPIDIYSKRFDYKTEYFVFKENPDTKIIIIIPKNEPNLDYFSPYEKTLMQNLIEIFADSSIHSGHMSEATHQKIEAWKITWKENPNGIIDKSKTFLFGKELTPAEEHFLVAKGLK